ncbi:hypothetical protein SBA1_170059 [Candidatus Sulfotelmatobacter kueseliae]|uniref:Uncharacterized protein n=1 Tax=Candidatus Sulfotelmatobacter kueseliae TaxID=2042962 RepID=A0A2U3KB88_9BACT|nr:hypothetical protein SBA1_170059 [Candidatus Sulfotelmatobacter kueseliae]
MYFQLARIRVISTRLKSAPFVTEECTRKEMLCRSASNASLFFSTLPSKIILASTSEQFKRSLALARGIVTR